MTDNKFTPDGLPTLNKHYRIADQVLLGLERRKKGEFQFECHKCIGKDCKQSGKCEQFAREQASRLKELLKQ